MPLNFRNISKLLDFSLSNAVKYVEVGNLSGSKTDTNILFPEDPPMSTPLRQKHISVNRNLNFVESHISGDKMSEKRLIEHTLEISRTETLPNLLFE